MTSNHLATIVVPMTPSPDLSPNARVHWARKARAVTHTRNVARVATLQCVDAADRAVIAARLHIGYRVEIAWERGRKGARDEDNALSMCKAILDGVADALEIDDARLHVRGISFDRTSRTGVVRVTLLEEPE